MDKKCCVLTPCKVH